VGDEGDVGGGVGATDGVGGKFVVGRRERESEGDLILRDYDKNVFFI